MHPENILLCAYLSDDDEMSKRALDIILKARKKEAKSKAKKIRKFVLPTEAEINWAAEDLMGSLKWELPSVQRKVFSPPLLRRFTDDELKNQKKYVLENHQGLMCHNQSNERVIQQVINIKNLNLKFNNELKCRLQKKKSQSS